MAIATWTAVNIDCPDSKALGEFYRDLTGMPLNEQDGFWYVGDQDGIMFFFQAVEDYVAPTWPTQERGQQMHLDIDCEDRQAMVDRAVELGATKLHKESSFTVMLDPAGHPFCLCDPH